MTKMKIKLSLVCLILALLGCVSSAEDQRVKQEVSAVVAEPSRQTNEEIQVAIASLLGQKEVVISANAFTKDSRLTIERLSHQTANGQLINGRVTEHPLLIELVKKGQQCLVKNVLTGKVVALKYTRCRALVE